MTLLLTLLLLAVVFLQATTMGAPIATVVVTLAAGVLTPFVTQLLKSQVVVASGRAALFITIGVSVALSIASAYITGEARSWASLFTLSPWIFSQATILYRLWYPSANSAGNVVVNPPADLVSGDKFEGRD